MIAFEHVTHTYGDVRAVDDVSLCIGAGETVALIGPSGSGKSTLLKLAIGLVPATGGRIVVADRELRADNVLDVRRQVGYVIQSGGLFPHLTARDNVTLAARVFGRVPAWIDQRLESLADLVQLPAELLERLPAELSGGQRQRVSLMRALFLDPQVLLLDEPLGALDPMVRYGLQEDLKRLFAQLGKSVLLVTHDLAEATFFSDHIVLMREGRIVQAGSYETLSRTPAEGFVGEFFRAQRALHVPPHA